MEILRVQGILVTQTKFFSEPSPRYIKKVYVPIPIQVHSSSPKFEPSGSHIVVHSSYQEHPQDFLSPVLPLQLIMSQKNLADIPSTSYATYTQAQTLHSPSTQTNSPKDKE